MTSLSEGSRTKSTSSSKQARVLPNISLDLPPNFQERVLSLESTCVPLQSTTVTTIGAVRVNTLDFAPHRLPSALHSLASSMRQRREKVSFKKNLIYQKPIMESSNACPVSSLIGLCTLLAITFARAPFACCGTCDSFVRIPRLYDKTSALVAIL